MEGELYNFLKTWITVVASLCYCYAAANITNPGPARLAVVLPVVILFVALPLNLTTVFLCGLTSFFVSWLATFKLLLAFGRGPLHSSGDPSLPLSRFILLACFPISIPNDTNPAKRHRETEPKSRLRWGIKLLIYATNLRVYRMREEMDPRVFMFLFAIYTYIIAEAIMAVMAWLARAWLGVELEPQFDEPYLSTSLQDFWGRRWNIMASNILRPTVYDPVRSISGRWIRREWAQLAAIMATFLVSGIMHEVIFYHLGRERPAWDVTGFFVLHGACLAGEIAAKRAVKGRWRLPTVVSGGLVMAFVMGTSMWLFWPALERLNATERGNAELLATIEFVRNMSRSVLAICRFVLSPFLSLN